MGKELVRAVSPAIGSAMACLRKWISSRFAVRGPIVERISSHRNSRQSPIPQWGHHIANCAKIHSQHRAVAPQTSTTHILSMPCKWRQNLFPQRRSSHCKLRRNLHPQRRRHTASSDHIRSHNGQRTANRDEIHSHSRDVAPQITK